MEICKIWLLLVHYDFKAFGSCFSVDVDISMMVDDLKKVVKESRSEALSRAHTDSSDIIVWKTKGKMVINNSTSKKRMTEILKSIDVDDVDVIEEINERVLLRDLELPDGQTLLVQLPGSSRVSIAVSCVLTDMSIRAHSYDHVA
jgi:hypothetical protein